MSAKLYAIHARERFDGAYGRRPRLLDWYVAGIARDRIDAHNMADGLKAHPYRDYRVRVRLVKPGADPWTVPATKMRGAR